ncbi:MAG: polysaccharide deacetylase family protein [Flavobacteriales bacterium]|nr:polysaccharide deacetylase family protein [Flavobacteriales bacterium]
MVTHARTRWPFLGLHAIAIAGLALGWWGAWPILITLLAHLALLAWGSATPGAGFFIAHARSLPEGQLALTYDDGPAPDRTPALLDLLKREQVQATFFCIGERVERAPELAKRIVDEGHAIAVHTHRHPWWWGFMPASIASKEIARCGAAIAKATGSAPALMRPPFGVTSPATARAMRRSGLMPVAWDLRSFDTMSIDADLLAARVVPQLKRSSIVLMHDTAPSAIGLTQELIREARTLGRKFVRLDAAMFQVRTVLAPLAFGAMCTGLLPQLSSAQSVPQPIAANDPLVMKLRAQAKADANVQAAFTQEKRIQGLAKPLASEGRLAFQAPDKLRWQVNSPAAMTVVVAGKSVRVQEQGKERAASPREKQVFTGVQRLIGALLTGSAFAESGMPAEFFRDAGALLVELKPEQAGMKNRIDRIQLRFSTATLALDELSILRPNGDATITRFHDAQRDVPLPTSTFTLP